MKEYVIDAKNMDEKELNHTIKEQAAYHDKLIIENPESKHNICAGLTEDVDIEINGSAGYFVGTMVNGPKIQINGNAGWFAGDNMTKGELIIEGTAGDGAGQGIYGGTVIVRGSIYVLGDVKSLGKNAIMEKTTLEDQNELKEILTKYGFELTDIDYTNFKKIVNIQ